MHSARYMGRSKNNGGAANVIIAIALNLIGYIGLFFGRRIKSAVSRQREQENQVKKQADLAAAAHSTNWAAEVLFYILLNNQPEMQEQQILSER